MFILLLLYSIIPCFKLYGIKNTLWYIFYLNANEFSHKLDLNIYYNKHKNKYNASASLLLDRQTAHYIEDFLNG